MIQFPNCKINLGLSILEKRTDGFHGLETIFYPVALTDGIEIVINKGHQNNAVEFTSSGNPIPGDVSGNLCVKAYDLLKKDFPLMSNIKIHLHKKIPIGAGLGGGSSDGASALIILNDLFQLHINQAQLILINDFEKAVFEAYPNLKKIKNELYQQGAIYASLSGSGSSLFGIFPKGHTLQPAPTFDAKSFNMI